MLNSALSLASWIAARILCLASVFTPCPALSPASWFAARYLCLASVFSKPTKAVYFSISRR